MMMIMKKEKKMFPPVQEILARPSPGLFSLCEVSNKTGKSPTVGLTVYLLTLHDQAKKEVSNLLDCIFCGEQPRELIGNKETILATKSSNHAIKR